MEETYAEKVKFDVEADFMKQESANLPEVASNNLLAELEALEHPEKPTEFDIEYFKSTVRPRLFQLSNMIYGKAKERDIFNFLGISPSKFDLYKKWFPEFRNAVAQGKAGMVDRMVNALETIGLGTKYEESEIINVYEPTEDVDDNGKRKMKLVQRKERITSKVLPPNIRAIETYLTNRDAANWKKSQPDNFTQNNNATLINITDEQMKKMINSFQNSFMSDTKSSDEKVVDVPSEVLESKEE